MADLRENLIKLANGNPDLRKHLVPLLSKTAMEHDSPEALKKYLQDHPKADKSNHTVKKPVGKNPGAGESEAKPVALSKQESQSVADALSGWNEPGSWGHVVSYAIAGKPMEPKHVKKVLADIDGYLKDWDNVAKQNQWSPQDKKSLTKGKAILERSMKKTAGQPVNYFRELELAERRYHSAAVEAVVDVLKLEGATIKRVQDRGSFSGFYKEEYFEIDLFWGGNNPATRHYLVQWRWGDERKKVNLDWREFDSSQMASQIVYRHFSGFVG